MAYSITKSWSTTFTVPLVAAPRLLMTKDPARVIRSLARDTSSAWPGMNWPTTGSSWSHLVASGNRLSCSRIQGPAWPLISTACDRTSARNAPRGMRMRRSSAMTVRADAMRLLSPSRSESQR